MVTLTRFHVHMPATDRSPAINVTTTAQSIKHMREILSIAFGEERAGKAKIDEAADDLRDYLT